MRLHVSVYPGRRQLLDLRRPDPQLRASIASNGIDVVHKADGTTLAGRQRMLAAALYMAPSLEDAEIVKQVIGLRTGLADRLPLIDPVSGWRGLYMLAGHCRSGMLLRAMRTRIIAELMVHGTAPIPSDVFRPDRFGPRQDEG